MKTFDEIFEKLNQYQKEAVTDESMTTLVNANVGSGKTTVLITKVFYQHFQKNVDFKDMVVLTFTNKAMINQMNPEVCAIRSKVLKYGARIRHLPAIFTIILIWIAAFRLHQLPMGQTKNICIHLLIKFLNT